jgi:hypothetical protein
LFAVSGAWGQSARLDTTTLVVLGEGLGAGVNNFSLSETGQESSFGALAARQIGTIFPQPIFQGPGIGNVVGFQELPLRLPAALQTTVRKRFPPTLFVFNLSVPGLRVADAATRRPTLPLIHQGDSQQTLINFILGFPQLILEDDVPLWSQLEYAAAMRPTFAVVELGYSEVLEAAVTGDLSRLPDPAAFRASYDQIVSTLRGGFAQVVVQTIPDPLDTAYFSDPLYAAQLLRVPPFVILGLFGVSLEDWITVPGLVEMGNQFLARQVTSIPSGSVLPSSVGAEIRSAVAQLNNEIRSVASSRGAVVHDLNAVFRAWKENGVVAGDRKLTADFLGGLYSLNGYYPGATGHALIANDLLSLLNQTYGRQFPLVGLGAILGDDPVADYRISTGAEISLSELAEFVPASRMREILQTRDRLERDRRPSLPVRRGVTPERGERQ